MSDPSRLAARVQRNGRARSLALFAALLAAVVLPLMTTGAVARAASRASTTPGYLTILLGRALYAEGDWNQATSTCDIPNSPSGQMMTMDQVVPAMAAMGIDATAAVIPAHTQETSVTCGCVTCSVVSAYPSWSDLSYLRDNDGLTVISGSYDHADPRQMTPSQQEQESCGSLAPIIAHGNHRAWGMFAYPDGFATQSMQTDIVQSCFAYGQEYAVMSSPPAAQTNTSPLSAPWFQDTVTVGGGHCNDNTQPCFSEAPWLYASPDALAALANVAPGSWTALKFYTFVTGTNQDGGALQWDCTNPDWHEHWTSTYETYCWNDFQAAMAQVASSGVVVTDPATVAESWGRIPTPLVSVDSTSPSTLTDQTPSTTVTWHSYENGTYTVLSGGADCNSGTAVGSGSYTTAPNPATVTVPTSALSWGQDALRVCLTNDANHTGSAQTTVTVDAVTGVTPSSGPLAGGTQVTITGTNFTPDATVTVGGQPASNIAVTSPTSITATVPAAPGDASGVQDVVVTEASGTSPTSTADQYDYQDPGTGPPAVAAVSPPSAPADATAQVTITGSNFTSDATVWVDGVVASGVVVSSPSSITATIPASPNQAAGTYDVVVSEAAGTSTTSAADDFSWTTAPPGAPGGVSAAGGAASATVSFAAAATNGSPVTGYTVTAADATTPANGGQTASGAAGPLTVTGLTNGDSYTFTVTATNGVGTGPASAASNAVTPRPLLAVTTTKLPLGVVGARYSVSLAATGGLKPYRWSLAAGSSLPAGLGLAGNLVTGTPTAPGSTTVTVQVQDAVKPADVATATLPITIDPVAADGSGTATIRPGTVTAGSTGNVLTFRYIAPASAAVRSGTVQVTVPSGWTPPSTTPTDPGYARTTLGSLTVSGQVITVSGLTLAPGQAIAVTYGNIASGAQGLTAPTTTGPSGFATAEASTSTGTLQPLAASPAVKVSTTAHKWAEHGALP